MRLVSREALAAHPLMVWLGALLGSLLVHAALVAVVVHWRHPLPPKARVVVPVETINLAQLPPAAKGGGGGQPASAVTPAPPTPAPPPKPKVLPPRPRQPKPKPLKVEKPLERPALPETPVPPSLALPRPAAPPKPGPSGPAATGVASRPGSGSGPGGGGGGQGGGSGSGSGPGLGPGAGTGSLLQGYLREVRRLLERQKQYPRAAQRLNIQGVAVLNFTIHADGSITTTRVSRSSGNGLLDEAAQGTVRRVGRFPPLPPALGRDRLAIEIPLSFKLTEP